MVGNWELGWFFFLSIFLNTIQPLSVPNPNNAHSSVLHKINSVHMLNMYSPRLNPAISLHAARGCGVPLRRSEDSRVVSDGVVDTVFNSHLEVLGPSLQILKRPKPSPE